MAKAILGVDMGYDNMKLALVRDGEVKKTVSVPMPKNMVRDGKIVSAETMSEMVRDAMKENGIRATEAAYVVPSERTYVKTVSLPLMTADQLMYNLPFEFRDYITGEIKDFLFDYAMISETSGKAEKKGILSPRFGNRGKTGRGGAKNAAKEEGGGRPEEASGDGGGEDAGRMELLAVSVPREEIEGTRALLRKAGLRLTKAAPAMCAYINLIRLNEYGEDDPHEYCILDLGYQAIRLNMYRGDRHMVTRLLDVGLSTLDEVIADAYGADIHIAHTYLLTNYDGCQEREECMQAYDNISMELMRVMNFYRYSNPDSNITDIWICGGGANIPPLCEAIADTLGLDLHPAGDLIPGHGESERLSSFVQAIGVAMG